MTELAKQYRKSADLIEERIVRLKEELKKSRGKETLSLEKRIELLRFESANLSFYATYMENYYI